MTRLTSLQISGFRAFTTRAAFDLDADVILLSGPNGSGKTSFFDSILWTLTGELPRFGGREPEIVSLYVPSRHARVELQCEDSEGHLLTVIRSVSRGEDPKLLVTTNGVELEGAGAEAHILRLFWPAALQTTDPRTAFCTALTRSVYLQQDLVRQFIESDTEEERFSVLSELVGAGRLGEYLRELESSRNAWSRTRTERERSLGEAEMRVREIEARLERLQSLGDDDDLETSWAAWWETVASLGLESVRPSLASVEASQALSELLSVLQAERRAAERRHRAAAELLDEWDSRLEGPRESYPSIEELRAKQSAIAADLEVRRHALATAQEAAERQRTHLTQRREREAELRSLAALALRHIDDNVCPVCGQRHDTAATRQRLEAVAKRAETDAEPLESVETLGELARQVASAESQLVDADLQIHRAERAVAEEQEWRGELLKRLDALELSEDSDPSQLRALIRTLTEREHLLGDLFERGERLALAVARNAEAAQRSELLQQLSAARQAVDERGRVLELHEKVGDLASRILDAGRAATREAVDERVHRIEPLVERIYARMDPHPAFTKVHLGTSYPRGRGRVQTLVGDPTAGLEDKDPYTLFSSSQLNALAVSIFLGLNLGGAEAPLGVAMLDDPLQSLDDVNLLGLVDTLRRTKALRQLLVSTHDARLASLLERKLRPVGDDRRTRVYAFEGWTPAEGPVVTPGEVPGEPEEIRVAAA